MNRLPFATSILNAYVSMWRCRIFLVALFFFAGFGACVPTQMGATDAQMASGRDRATAGASVFDAECAHCHGQRGEGVAGAFGLFGPGSLPEYPRDVSNAIVTDPQQILIAQQTRPAGAPWRDPFRNAQDLFDYVKIHLPPRRATEMKSDDYWAVVTFVYAVRGAEVPSGGINADNARGLPSPR
jgi:mono/diheme cytochrome c family protein